MNEVTLTEKEIAQQAYNQVVADAELGDIRLIELNFSVKPEYFDAENVPHYKANYESKVVNVSYDPEEKSLGGMFEWQIVITHRRKKLLTVKAVYIIVYDNVPQVDAVHAEAFLRKVGKFATYPYFRATVSQLSWASRADMPVLPVLK